MDAVLRAGIAIFNAGDYHEAHDAWEDHWLELAAETDDERFLHGLIQYTAAVHHATTRNWEGATGLAESGRGYLAGLPSDYRRVNVGAVRAYLAALAGDPELIERRAPPRLTHEGDVVTIDDLVFAEIAIVAGVYAEANGFDEAVVERAIDYGEADLAADEPSSPFVSLLVDFATEPDTRAVSYQRLTEHVDRRTARDGDVEGLFEE